MITNFVLTMLITYEFYLENDKLFIYTKLFQALKLNV